MRNLLATLLVVAVHFPVATASQPFTFAVKHDHVWGAATGLLQIEDNGIAYSSEMDPEHSRKWDYTEIQELKIVSATRVRILTYEDVWWRLNSDRWIDLVLTDQEITAEVTAFLGRHLTTPLVSSVFHVPDEALYVLPVKHRHALGGGCRGKLLLTQGGLHYTSENAGHRRVWTFDEILGVGHASDFDLRVTVRERQHHQSQRNFQFQLKRALSNEVSNFLWRKVYEPESWLDSSR